MPSQAPSLTMLVVSYNQERFIEEALRAALAQTHQPLQILVSDDASTDGTFGVIERVVRDYRGPHTVRVNRNETNLGLMGHIYRCIELIDTEWVVAAAGDDVSAPHRVERIAAALSRHPGVDAVASGTKDIDEHGQSRAHRGWRLPRIGSPFIGPVRSTQRGRLLGYLMNDDGYVLGCGAAWKRRLFTDFPRVDPDCTEDSAVGFRAAMGGGVCVIAEELVAYRRHDSNIWSVAPDKAAALKDSLAARRRRIQSGVIRQYEGDLDFAESKKLIEPGIAAEVRAALQAKRAAIDLWLTADRVDPRLVAGFAAHVAIFTRGQAPERVFAWERLDGWVRRKARRLLARALARDLRLR
ncbi:MAG: glycosyltransferase [Planctomycetota bacterium]